MKNTEMKVISIQAYHQKLFSSIEYIQTIRANIPQPSIAESNKPLIVSKKNNFLVILLNPNFSSITNVE
jgi:hypothetical protein